MPGTVDDGGPVDQGRLVYGIQEEVDRGRQVRSKDLDQHGDAVVRRLIRLDLDMVELVLK